MTAKIIKISLAREGRSPFAAGPVKCGVCGHEEPAILAPAGRKYFECTKCGAPAAVRTTPALPKEGVPRQACPDCEGQVFAIMADTIMCTTCGTTLAVDWSP